MSAPAIMYADGPQLPHVWASLREMIEPCCGDVLTVDGVRAEIQRGEALAWIVVEGARPTACAVTRQHERNGQRWLEAVTLGRAKDAPPHGLRRWDSELEAALVRRARETGCGRVEAQCRPAMARVLERRGWARRGRRGRYVMMEYPIDG